MASAIARSHCVSCRKDRATSKCNGCLQDFCYNHLTDHRNQLNEQLDQIQDQRNSLRDQINNPTKTSLIEQIDQWERQSIRIIQQTANKCREVIFISLTEHIPYIEKKFNKLTEQIKTTKQENDFNEKDLSQFISKENLPRIKQISKSHFSPCFTDRFSFTELFDSFEKVRKEAIIPIPLDNFFIWNIPFR